MGVMLLTAMDYVDKITISLGSGQVFVTFETKLHLCTSRNAWPEFTTSAVRTWMARQLPHFFVRLLQAAAALPPIHFQWTASAEDLHDLMQRAHESHIIRQGSVTVDIEYAVFKSEILQVAVKVANLWITTRLQSLKKLVTPNNIRA